MTRTGNGKVSCGIRSGVTVKSEGVDQLAHGGADDRVAPPVQDAGAEGLGHQGRGGRWCSGESISRMVRPMTCPMVIAFAAEENRTLSVSTCCASSWLVTVNRDEIRGAFSSVPVPARQIQFDV